MDAGMDAAQLRALCDTFALGTPLGQPQTVTGGLLHRMWRLATERGDFAMKELSRGYLHHPESVEIFASTERIAARMAAAGIPALAALETPTGPLLTLGEAAFLVYPWVDGQLLPPGPVEPSVARTIGALLGRIHRLNLTDTEGEASAGEIHVLRDDEWVLLARRGEAARLPWAAGLRELQTSLVLWNARYRRVLGDLLKTVVISHRDLDQKNVLWRGPDDPVLVDWESAGAINPAVELAGVALDMEWSGHRRARPGCVSRGDRGLSRRGRNDSRCPA
jgi:Ser/Thr protein kinase RdoA (MazF antagonist)